MKVLVRHKGKYTNGHSYSRVTKYNLETYVPFGQANFEEWWEELLFNDTGDNVTESGVGSWYGATIIAADDATLIGKSWEWVD